MSGREPIAGAGDVAVSVPCQKKTQTHHRRDAGESRSLESLIQLEGFKVMFLSDKQDAPGQYLTYEGTEDKM